MIANPDQMTTSVQDAKLASRNLVSEPEPRLDRVVAEHLHGVERVLVEVLADQRELLEQVVGDGDDVAAESSRRGRC